MIPLMLSLQTAYKIKAKQLGTTMYYLIFDSTAAHTDRLIFLLFSQNMKCATSCVQLYARKVVYQVSRRASVKGLHACDVGKISTGVSITGNQW